MDNNNVDQELTATFEDLLRTISLFNTHYSNVPFPESWTPAQVVEHVLLSAEGFAEVVNADGETAQRSPFEKIEEIKSIFLNFDIKMKSPEFICPPLKD